MDRKIKISHWDAAEFLESQDDIDAYLEAAYETGDSKQIAKALSNIAKARAMLDISGNFEGKEISEKRRLYE